MQKVRDSLLVALIFGYCTSISLSPNYRNLHLPIIFAYFCLPIEGIGSILTFLFGGMLFLKHRKDPQKNIRYKHVALLMFSTMFALFGIAAGNIILQAAFFQTSNAFTFFIVINMVFIFLIFTCMFIGIIYSNKSNIFKQSLQEQEHQHE